MKENNIKTHCIGTPELGISYSLRMGSYTLSRLVKDNLHLDLEQHTSEANVVILIRDTIDRMRSGYWHQMQWAFDPYLTNKFNNKIIQHDFSRAMELAHFKNGGWFNEAGKRKYASVDCWVRGVTLGPDELEGTVGGWVDLNLKELSKFDNFWFLDLKDLCNPKFLEWLQEKDSGWEKVNEIKYQGANRTPNWFWPQMDIFWSEYNAGKVLKDKTLINPFENSDVLDRAIAEQKNVDFIRKHARYINL